MSLLCHDRRLTENTWQGNFHQAFIRLSVQGNWGWKYSEEVEINIERKLLYFPYFSFCFDWHWGISQPRVWVMIASSDLSLLNPSTLETKHSFETRIKYSHLLLPTSKPMRKEWGVDKSYRLMKKLFFSLSFISRIRLLTTCVAKQYRYHFLTDYVTDDD